ncbi:hypothetical protein DSO57_1034434 [Entomophthora muscae]|uniref:Uncharacterized protein n=1 Tax=Entomophthora muscae TaxID=34485 RepID=A0ACC2RQT6_9FUNG|nr:hypothetical protein DSO57_1034434 [Entomophthora muscae]
MPYIITAIQHQSRCFHIIEAILFIKSENMVRLCIATVLIMLSAFGQSEPQSGKGGWTIPRIVAVGDLHGDHQNAVKVLKMTNVIDADLKWAGGDRTILVQTVRGFNLQLISRAML